MNTEKAPSTTAAPLPTGNTITLPTATAGPDAPPQAKPLRPENVPEAYWDADKGEVNTGALLKALAEKDTKPSTEPDDTDPAHQQQVDAVSGLLQKHGLEYASFDKEFAEGGKLSDDSYAKLDKAGFPRAMVEQYLAGNAQAQASALELAEQDIADIKKTVGGDAQFGVLQNWAANGGMTEEQAYTYNALVNSGNKSQALAAVSYLKTLYAASEGEEPRGEVRGVAKGVSAVAPFRSTAEVTAAMRDVRYRKDPAYRAEVETRLAASDVFGPRR